MIALVLVAVVARPRAWAGAARTSQHRVPQHTARLMRVPASSTPHVRPRTPSAPGRRWAGCAPPAPALPPACARRSAPTPAVAITHAVSSSDRNAPRDHCPSGMVRRLTFCWSLPGLLQSHVMSERSTGRPAWRSHHAQQRSRGVAVPTAATATSARSSGNPMGKGPHRRRRLWGARSGRTTSAWAARAPCRCGGRAAPWGLCDARTHRTQQELCKGAPPASGLPTAHCTGAAALAVPSRTPPLAPLAPVHLPQGQRAQRAQAQAELRPEALTCRRWRAARRR